jgi:hypothetical protein
MDVKRLYDLFPELSKKYDPSKPIQQQGTEKIVRHLMAGDHLDEAPSKQVDAIQADKAIQEEGFRHPNKLKYLNALRRKLGIS